MKLATSSHASPRGPSTRPEVLQAVTSALQQYLGAMQCDIWDVSGDRGNSGGFKISV